jgi:hypothetical protein
MAVDTFDTAAATTDGLYSLTGYEHLIHDNLWDTTNETTINHESYSTLQGIDPNKETTGPPEYWADAGVDTNDERQIYLWPIPDGTYTVRFSGYKKLTDLGESDDTLDKDPFFGLISPWSACFASGMRYYQDLNNNEDANQAALQLNIFNRLIRDRKATNMIAPTSKTGMEIVRHAALTPFAGRLDPAHYNNRG